MAVIFTGRSLLQHLFNVLAPLLDRGFAGFRRNKDARRLLKKRLKEKRKQANHPSADESTESINNIRVPQFFIDANLADIESELTELDGYNSAITQFGFIVLFSLAFPLAPILGAFHNTIQRKIGKCSL